MNVIIPDKVSATSKRLLEAQGFVVTQKAGIGIDEANTLAKGADALIVRSYSLHELSFHLSLKAIGRAGAGVNNIPVEGCTKKGVVVFNTPGANANAVKELVLCGLLLSSRQIIDSVNWTSGQKEHGENLLREVEKNKGQFRGSEIAGKTLGVVGLGAVGMLVANDAVALGMRVIGHDPYLSVDNAWHLSKEVKKAESLDSLLSQSDYLTIHVPLLDSTNRMFNAKLFAKMKRGIRIMNFSRYEIISGADLIAALGSGIVARYVTDFPTHDLLGVKGVIAIPHLGASTEEAEENCAVMAAKQIAAFLKEGTITNSVNFPDCSLPRGGKTRLTLVNLNVPKMIEKITTALGEANLNITDMVNKSRGDIAYTIIDLDQEVDDEMVSELGSFEGIVKVRKI